jgi:hypothetical protein
MLSDDDDRWRLVDFTVPNVARIYDCLLGGKDNFEVDRQAATKLMQVVPDAPHAARANRMFLHRAVKYLAASEGIRQFIDIGTGLPTQGNTHEIVRSVNMHARVMYVDYDPVVVTHARALLEKGNEQNVSVHTADLRRPKDIIMRAIESKLINLDKPVAILLVAILHFIRDDEDPYGIVDTLKDAMPSGSYLALTHVTHDAVPEEDMRQAEEVYSSATAPIVTRSLEDVTQFFSGLDVVTPGVVDVNEWRPGPGELLTHARTIFYGGVAMKP